MPAMVVVLFLIALVFGPFFTIWALNTLFALGIAYTFKTWLAMVLLSMAFGNTKFTFKSEKK